MASSCAADKDSDQTEDLNGTAGESGAAGDMTANDAGQTSPEMKTYSNLTITSERSEVSVGDTLAFTAEATYVDAESGEDAQENVTDMVDWTSSAPSTAAFSDASPSELDAIAPGEVEISAHLGELSSSPLRVTVMPSVELTIEPASFSGIVGERIRLQAMAREGDAPANDVTAEVNWSTSNEQVVIVENGIAIIRGEGTGAVTASFAGSTAEMTVEGLPCNYPAHNRRIAFQEVFPPLGWTDAYLPDGSTTPFSMAEFHCSPKYADKNILIFVLGAGWCPACERFTTNILGPIAEELYGNGTLIVWHEAQDANYNSADSRFAFQHIGQLIDEGPGIRVGGVDALMLENSGEYNPAPDFVMDEPIVTGFPSVWVIRRSDMTMIADQGRGRYYLPFTLIANEPDADWSDPPPPPFRSNCLEGEEEESEPNNQANMAARLNPGVVDGAICEREPDFYRIMMSGEWRATLNFEASEGDLDMYVYDKDTGNPVLDADGRAVASNGTGDIETITHSGRSILVVYGYNAASANYSLTLEEL